MLNIILHITMRSYISYNLSLIFCVIPQPSHPFYSLIKEMRPDGAEKEPPHRAITETPIHSLISDDIKKELYATGQ